MISNYSHSNLLKKLHNVAAKKEAEFVSTFARGTEWTATGAVTPSPEGRLAKPTPQPPRLLVVTGGHDYPTSFYTVFEGADDLHWTHAVSNHEAFKSDLPKEYEVLVLYDLSSEITDSEKSNLKNFVESGKGVVVLHHAIADYPTWEWWYKEVVGGKYLPKPEGNVPASTYKHDEELCVRPVVSHPILSRVGSMHLYDETYKVRWISPEVKVLLKTDNATSDGPVAWVSIPSHASSTSSLGMEKRRTCTRLTEL